MAGKRREPKKIDKFTVLSSKENVKKILAKISADELQEIFKDWGGLALKIDEKLDGPFIGFYNIRTEEALYYSVNEFIEGARAGLWTHKERLK